MIQHVIEAPNGDNYYDTPYGPMKCTAAGEWSNLLPGHGAELLETLSPRLQIAEAAAIGVPPFRG
jgi:hypothetical protein